VVQYRGVSVKIKGDGGLDSVCAHIRSRAEILVSLKSLYQRILERPSRRGSASQRVVFRTSKFSFCRLEDS
jgi:hypothetical protein